MTFQYRWLYGRSEPRIPPQTWPARFSQHFKGLYWLHERHSWALAILLDCVLRKDPKKERQGENLSPSVFMHFWDVILSLVYTHDVCGCVWRREDFTQLALSPLLPGFQGSNSGHRALLAVTFDCWVILMVRWYFWEEIQTFSLLMQGHELPAPLAPACCEKAVF